MYSLVSNNSRLTHPLARVFLKFVILSPTKGIYVVCFDYVSKNGNFFFFSVFCFFYRAASVNSVQATVALFSAF